MVKLNTQEAVREVFLTAVRQELMGLLKHDHEWQRFKNIADEAEARIRQEEEAWKSDYPKRLAEAQQIILREAHGNILEPPKPEGIDAIPDKAALDQKADQRIRQDHQRRIAAIRKDEINQYQELKHSALGREAAKGRVRTEFEKVRGQSRTGPTRG